MNYAHRLELYYSTSIVIMPLLQIRGKIRYAEYALPCCGSALSHVCSEPMQTSLSRNNAVVVFY